MITGACAQETIIPGDSTNATLVAAHRLQQLVLRCIPDLQFTRVGAYSKKGSVAGPLDASDAVLGANIAQLGDLAVLSRPEVNAGAEADRQDVLRGPVHQVEVEIVLQARRIEHLKRLLRNHSLLAILL